MDINFAAKPLADDVILLDPETEEWCWDDWVASEPPC